MLRIHAPANSSYEIYVSSASQPNSDGTPSGQTVYHCAGRTEVEGDYECIVDAYALAAGQTYWWWLLLKVPDGSWIYSVRAFTVTAPPSGGVGGGGGGGSGNNGPHVLGDAALLPASAHFASASIKQTRLSRASYALSKLIGAPRTVAVACWNPTDWANIGGASDDGIYTRLAFWDALMPHWIHLSPGICRGIETLLYHRSGRATARLAEAVETVTHEMMHAIGINRQHVGNLAEPLA
jgi:hypothetical protein